MMGLPTETDEDLCGIAQIVRDVIYTFRKTAKNKARGIKINVGVSTFVPRPRPPSSGWDRPHGKRCGGSRNCCGSS